MRVPLHVLFYLAITVHSLHASGVREEKSLPVAVPRFESEPVIDGQLDEPIWKEAAVLQPFYQTQPGDNTSPSFPTEAMLGHNSKFLFIGIRCFDEQKHIRTTVAKRDDIGSEDHVAIYLDTFNDLRKAYVLMFNPLGVQQDGIFIEDGVTDYSVDIVMESKGMLTTEGYSIEIAVPFSSLRYESGPGILWGIHVLRQIKHLDEENSWMPLSRNKTTVGTAAGSQETKARFLSQAGRIRSPQQVTTGRVLEVIPVLTPSETGRRMRARSSERNNPYRFLNQPVDLDFGITAKLSLTPSVTLTSAVNPDFAEVEADQPQITANQRFPLFFDEKRAFFLEGIEIFRTPIQAIHTRTIIDPDIAFKFSGKQDRNSFGLMLVRDEAPGNFTDEELFDPSIERFINKDAYTALFRLRRDVSDQSSLGLVATSYSFIEKHNHLGGIDGRFNIGATNQFTFQLLGTNSRQFFYDPDHDNHVYRTGNGLGYHLEYNKTGRNLNLLMVGQGYTSDYRADLGFTLRTNTNRWSGTFRYNSEPKSDSPLISWSFLFTTLAQYDWQGRMQYSYIYPRILFNFKRQTFLNLYAYGDYARLLEEEFGPKRSATQQGAFAGDSERSTIYKGLLIEAGTSPSQKYSVSASLDLAWEFFDYDFGGGPRFPRVSPAALADPNAPLDPGPGSTLYFTSSAAYQPIDALRISFDYTKSRLTRNDTRLVAFDQNLYTLRTNYFFTRFTFARARIDYDSLTGNVTGQFLCGWTPNPGTSFYVGYNEDLNFDGFNPFTNHLERGFRRNHRTFFIKLSYLFRHEM